MRSMLTLALAAIVAGSTVLAGPQTYTIKDDGVKAPVLIKEVKPTYTEGAIRRRVQGMVEVEAVVLTDGKVGDVRVKQSLDPELDEQAVNATKQWEFKPGTKDGQAVNVLVNIELTFTLKK